MNKLKKEFLLFNWRVTSLHMISYFIAGILAFVFMKYERQFATGNLSIIMKSTDSPWIAIAPALQIIRGFIISLVLYPFKDVFLSSKYGWLRLWLLIIGLSYFSTIGPTPGSFEGLFFTKFTMSEHLLGIPETLLYTFLFSFLLCFWYKKPSKTITINSIIFVILIIIMSTLGALSGLGILKN